MKLLFATLALAAASFAVGQDGTVDRAAYAQRMNAMTGSDWRPGMGFGQELAALPSPIGFEILRDNWRRGAHVEPRKQMFKGFVFQNHPDTLKVLHLGATDPDLGMQNWTFEYLKRYAFQNFAEDYRAYKDWYAKYGNRPVKEVRAENGRRFLENIVSATGAERQRLIRAMDRYEIGADIPAPPGMIDILDSMLDLPKFRPEETRAFLSIAKTVKPSEQFLRDRILPVVKSTNDGEKGYALVSTLGQLRAPWVLDALLEEAKRRVAENSIGVLSFPLGEAIAEQKDPRAIPVLIAVIDSHNGYDTVYGLGYFGLSKLTGVSYDPSHDGAWWRQWWENNRERFPAEVRDLPIPTLPRSPGYVAPKPPPPAGQPVNVDDLHTQVVQRLKEGRPDLLAPTFEALAKAKEPRSIPVLIGAVLADDTPATRQTAGRALSEITGVQSDESHDAAWWRRWWDRNRERFPQAVAKAALPRYTLGKKPDPSLVVPDAEDVADLPAEAIFGGGDRDMRAFLTGPRAPAPAKGYRLLVVLPGGDGSAEFFPFLKRVAKSSLPSDTLLMQLVAKKWSDDEDRVVWPQARMNPQNGRFLTEEFVAKAIDAAAKKYRIDREHVYACGWSSGGPGVWATLLKEGSPLKGAFVAMSVYKPDFLPPAANAKGKRVYILHSPDDFIPIAMAEKARDELKAAGATVQYATYEGGHGWHGDVFGYFRDAINFLVKRSD